MKVYTLWTIGLVALVCLTFSLTPTYGQDSQQFNVFDFRTIDGSFNDLRNSTEGMVGNDFIRMHDKSYYFRDGNTMIDRGNARRISNQMFHQYSSRPDQNNLSSLVFTFLQFLDHDITFTRQGSEAHPILIPEGDPQFDPLQTGKMTIPFNRVALSSRSSNQRQQVNELTAWIDASNVYGSDLERATWLRSGQCGKMKVSRSSHGDLLPCNTFTGDCNGTIDPNAPEMDGDHNRLGQANKVFVAGDIRANEQPGLTALHTLFVREHNRICDELVKKYGCRDEMNYQMARKIVGGLIQSIVYNELLPLLGVQLEEDTYDVDATGNIHNSFATAAYRLGHTMVTEELPLVFENCNNSNAAIELMPLKDAFFNPGVVLNEGIQPILKGLSVQTQEAVDAKVVSAIRNFLFGAPGSGGLDLAALNIQRGRDHGLPDYNSLRIMLGLSPVRNFTQITTDLQVAASLEDIYNSVNNIDAWVGMLAEDHLSRKSIGATLHELLSYQFNHLRKADRFYYTRDPVLENNQIKDITRTYLADIIERNTNLNNLNQVFINNENCLPTATVSKTNSVECNEVLVSHTTSGHLSIQGTHGVNYSFKVSRDPMGILVTDNCMMLCGDFFETDLARGTYYVTVKNRKNRTVCDARIEIEPAIAVNSRANINSDFFYADAPPSLTVYPNPSSSIMNVQIDMPTEETSTFYLTNTLGQIVLAKNNITENQFQLDVSDLPAGIYEVVVQTVGQPKMLRQKVSIQ